MVTFISNNICCGDHMTKKIIMIIMTALVLAGCVQNQNLTEEEKEAYRKAQKRYEWGQKGR